MNLIRTHVKFLFLLGAIITPVFIPKAYGITKKIAVSAESSSFTSTGITIAAGATARVRATGLISYGSQGPVQCQGTNVPPDGCSESVCRVAGNCGALIGRLNGGTPFIIGASKDITEPGLLELAVNDIVTLYGDNSGSFNVTITAETNRSISGTITGTVCDSTPSGLNAPPPCSVAGIALQRVEAKLNGNVVAYTKSKNDGTYKIKLKKNGRYVVEVVSSNSKFAPRSKTVKVKDSDVPGIDFQKKPPSQLTVYSKLIDGTDNRYTVKGNALIAKGGTLHICNKDPFMIWPYSESSSNQFDFNRYGQKCKSKRVKNPTDSPYGIEIFDHIHTHSDIIVYVAP